jgi:pimeloyl-ACP methyl ester carboxylesterase
LWRKSIEVLGTEFKTYALDFFGFGESFDRQGNFSVDNFVQSVNQFLDRLGIPKAPIIGHSMGGTVALAAAMRYPEKVVKVGVVGSPIQGTSLNLLLKMSGYKGFASIIWTTPVLFKLFLRGYSYLMANDGRTLGNMMMSDLENVSVNSFFESIATLRDTDLRPHLNELKMPVLGVYGKKDIIVNPKQSAVLKACVPHSYIAWFEKSGHFPMMDESERFHQTLRDFLHNG